MKVKRQSFFFFFLCKIAKEQEKIGCVVSSPTLECTAHQGQERQLERLTSEEHSLGIVLSALQISPWKVFENTLCSNYTLCIPSPQGPKYKSKMIRGLLLSEGRTSLQRGVSRTSQK